MEWNFPFRETITCSNCGRQFEMVVTDKYAERHPCPSCGQVHTLDLNGLEFEANDNAKKLIEDAFRDFTFTINLG